MTAHGTLCTEGRRPRSSRVRQRQDEAGSSTLRGGPEGEATERVNKGRTTTKKANALANLTAIGKGSSGQPCSAGLDEGNELPRKRRRLSPRSSSAPPLPESSATDPRPRPPNCAEPAIPRERATSQLQNTSDRDATQEAHESSLKATLTAHLFTMAHQRAYPKTLCPSEVARATDIPSLRSQHIISDEVKTWRDLMTPLRSLCVELHNVCPTDSSLEPADAPAGVDGNREPEEQLEVLQHGVPLPREVSIEDIRGPIRVRLRKSP